MHSEIEHILESSLYPKQTYNLKTMTWDWDRQNECICQQPFTCNWAVKPSDIYNLVKLKFNDKRNFKKAHIYKCTCCKLEKIVKLVLELQCKLIRLSLTYCILWNWRMKIVHWHFFLNKNKNQKYASYVCIEWNRRRLTYLTS